MTEEEKSETIFITSEARADFAGPEHIGSLVPQFASGNIRSVIVATVWADGEVGGEYHIEPGDKTKMIAHLKKYLRLLERGK